MEGPHTFSCRHARPSQRAPKGDWLVWLFSGGRGTGKTRAGAEWVLDQVWNQGKKRIALIARTPADARDVMIYGDSGIMAVSDPHERPIHEPTKRRLVFPNGAQCFTYSAAAPSQLRGPQHDAAWCFIAGTMIDTPTGRRPIEDLRPGDAVLTRHGVRRVTDLQRRIAPVGSVSFSHGQRLIGTGEHPVLTLHGWTRLDELAQGEAVCAGDSRQTAISLPTPKEARSTNTAGSGSKPMAQSQRGGTSTIEMVTLPTMTSATLRQSRPVLTDGGTLLMPSQGPSSAWTADTLLSGSSTQSANQSVNDVSSAGQTPNEQRPGSADTAATSFRASGEPSVVSVASTWLDAGSDWVYNLTVEGEHEYVANGVVVHNCDETAAWFDARKGDVLDTSWNNLMLGLRLGENPQCFVTTTPKRVRLIREIMERKSTAITTDTTYSNLKNLADSFREQVLTVYEGTRIGRQELMGELLTDVDGALWTLENIDDLRVDLEMD